MKKSRLYSIIEIVLFVIIAVGYFLPYYNGAKDNMIKSIGEGHMIIGFVFLLIGLIGCIFNKKEIGYLTCGYFIGIHAFIYISYHANPQVHLSLKQIGIGAYLQFFPAFLAFMVNLISSFKNKEVVVSTGVRNNAQVKTTVNNGQMNMPVNSFQNLPVEQKEKEKTMPKPDLLAGTKVDNSSMFVNPSLLEPEKKESDMDVFKQVNLLSAQSVQSQPIPMNEVGPSPALNIPTPSAAPAPAPSAPEASMSVPPVPESPAPVEAPQSMPTNLMGGGVVMTSPTPAPMPVPSIPEAPALAEGPQSMPSDLMGGGVVMAPPAPEAALGPVPAVPEVPAPVEGPQSMPGDLMGGGVVMAPPAPEAALGPVPAVPEVPAPVDAPQSMPANLLGPAPAPSIPPVPSIPPIPTIPPGPVDPSSALGGLPTPSKEGGEDISNIMNQGPSMEEQLKKFNEQQAMANNSNIPKPDLLAGSNLSGILGNDSQQ